MSQAHDDHNNTIYGMSNVMLAAVIEYLQYPNHPMHAGAKELADKFLNSHREQRIKEQQEDMRRSRAAMSDEEWSRIVD